MFFRLTDLDNKPIINRGKVWGGINWKFGIDMYTPLYLK